MAKDTLANPGLVTTILGGVDESVDVIDTEERFSRAGGSFPYFLGVHQKMFGKKLIDAYPGKKVMAFHQTFNGICQYGYYLQTGDKLYYHLCVSPSDHRLKFALLQSFKTNLQNVTLDSLGQIGGISAGMSQLSKDTSHSCVFDFPDRPNRPVVPPGTDPTGPFPWPPIDDVDTTPNPIEPPVYPSDPRDPPGSEVVAHFEKPMDVVLITYIWQNDFQLYVDPNDGSSHSTYQSNLFNCGIEWLMPQIDSQVTEDNGGCWAAMLPSRGSSFGNATALANDWIMGTPTADSCHYYLSSWIHFGRLRAAYPTIGVFEGIIRGKMETGDGLDWDNRPPELPVTFRFESFLGGALTLHLDTVRSPYPPWGTQLNRNRYFACSGVRQDINHEKRIILPDWGDEEFDVYRSKGRAILGFRYDVTKQTFHVWTIPTIDPEEMWRCDEDAKIWVPQG